LVPSSARFVLLACILVTLATSCASRGPYGIGEVGASDQLQLQLLEGSLNYRESMVLPDNAEVRVWISDGGSAPFAKTTFATQGRQGSLPFQIAYDSSSVSSGRSYVLFAEIWSGPRRLFALAGGVPVLGDGHPKSLSLSLQRAPASAQAAIAKMEGSKWRLIGLAGEPPLDQVEVTLEFPDATRVTGNGSVNHFSGSVVIASNAITFGPLASTRRAGPQAHMDQERRFLEALSKAVSFERRDKSLLLTCAGCEQPLRFQLVAP
jgi:putative lipoprotein